MKFKKFQKLVFIFWPTKKTPATSKPSAREILDCTLKLRRRILPEHRRSMFNELCQLICPETLTKQQLIDKMALFLELKESFMVPRLEHKQLLIEDAQ